MHSSALLRIFALSALLSFGAFATPSQDVPSQPSTGDPVADAARKARAEQKTAPKPKKVFTNDDIPSAPPPPPPAPKPKPAAPVGGGGGGKKPAAKKKAPAKKKPAPKKAAKKAAKKK